MKSKPRCADLLLWLRLNLGKHCLAPLTGTDSRALAAAVHVLDLYSNGDETTRALALAAFAHCVAAMQNKPCVRWLAYHSIAYVMDWNDRDAVWRRAGLASFEHRMVCANEPAGLALQVVRNSIGGDR